MTKRSKERNSELILSLIVLLAATFLAAKGIIAAEMWLQVSGWIVGAYALARGIKKAGEGLK